MRLMDDGHSYATPQTAEAALVKALARIGRTLDDTRWFISINSVGRFVPTVHAVGKDVPVLLPLAHLHISVIG